MSSWPYPPATASTGASPSGSTTARRHDRHLPLAGRRGRGQGGPGVLRDPAAANFQACGQTGLFTCQNEPWSVFFSQNLNVLGGGSWTQATVTQVVHFGGVCQGGVSCTSNGNDNRDLFDDFGVAASATGLASITYSDDQFADNTGTANAGQCTSSQDSTGSCDHTDFATQTSGHGIF